MEGGGQLRGVGRDAVRLLALGRVFHDLREAGDDPHERGLRRAGENGDPVEAVGAAAAAAAEMLAALDDETLSARAADV